jgi:stress-induced morphogen
MRFKSIPKAEIIEDYTETQVGNGQTTNNNDNVAENERVRLKNRRKKSVPKRVYDFNSLVGIESREALVKLREKILCEKIPREEDDDEDETDTNELAVAGLLRSLNNNSNKNKNNSHNSVEDDDDVEEEEEEVDPRHVCKVCSKVYVGPPSKLKRHMRTHSDDKAYKCDMCNYRCFESHDLQKHKRVHSCEKPFQCPMCDKAFKDSSTLRNHKRIHTGEKPFKCDICEYEFKQVGHLIQHKRTHAIAKPFACVACDKTYTNALSKIRHQKRAHNIPEHRGGGLASLTGAVYEASKNLRFFQ